jgi:hypothetical protein
MAAFGGSAPLSRPDLPNAPFGPCFDGGYLTCWGPTFSPLTGFDSRCYRIGSFTARQVCVIMVIHAMTGRMGKGLFTSQGKEVFFWKIHEIR